MSRSRTILALYWLVGTIAWINGYLTGTSLERHRRPALAARVVDLTEAHLYDWAVDGDGGCPDCGGTGWVSFPDPFAGGAHLDAACPTCTRVTP